MKSILMAVYNAIEVDARVVRAAEALSNAGFHLTVISCNSSSYFSNKNFKHVNFLSKSKGGFLLFKFWVFFLRYVFKYRKNFDLIYVHDYFMPLAGLFAHKLTGKRWIYDAHELLLDFKGHKYSLRERFFLWIESVSITKADLVIAANEERCRIIRKIYRLKNTESVANISIVNRHERLLKKEDTVVYQGVLIPERRVENIIKAVALMPDSIRLKLIGGGYIEKYKKIAENLNISSRVTFTGRVSYDKLLIESQVCKVGIVSYLMNSLNNYYCSPNKLYEYSQLGIPMIVTPQPFLVSVVTKYGIGEVWDERTESIEDLAKKVQKIIENYETYCFGMSRFNTDYNHNMEMSKLCSAVSKIALRE